MAGRLLRLWVFPDAALLAQHCVRNELALPASIGVEIGRRLCLGAIATRSTIEALRGRMLLSQAFRQRLYAVNPKPALSMVSVNRRRKLKRPPSSDSQIWGVSHSRIEVFEKRFDLCGIPLEQFDLPFLNGFDQRREEWIGVVSSVR